MNDWADYLNQTPLIALARQEMGAKSGPARAQEVRQGQCKGHPAQRRRARRLGRRAIDERPPAKV